jgi:hypothetical protein
MAKHNESSNKTEITLKGSVEIVSEFFFTAINSILYQRGALFCVLFVKRSSCCYRRRVFS